jgi:hypothetical protein
MELKVRWGFILRGRSLLWGMKTQILEKSDFLGKSDFWVEVP